MASPTTPCEVMRRERELGYRGYQVLNYVREYIYAFGQSPSYRMICNKLGISTKGEVAEIVERLEKRGLLHRIGYGRTHRIQLGPMPRVLMAA